MDEGSDVDNYVPGLAQPNARQPPPCRVAIDVRDCGASVALSCNPPSSRYRRAKPQTSTSRLRSVPRPIRKGIPLRITLAGLQPKETLKSRQRQLAAVLSHRNSIRCSQPTSPRLGGARWSEKYRHPDKRAFLECAFTFAGAPADGGDEEARRAQHAQTTACTRTPGNASNSPTTTTASSMAPPRSTRREAAQRQACEAPLPSCSTPQPCNHVTRPSHPRRIALAPPQPREALQSRKLSSAHGDTLALEPCVRRSRRLGPLSRTLLGEEMYRRPNTSPRHPRITRSRSTRANAAG
ncbi:hypothetical protein C8R46DRAFT_1210112 [Mycena filopes]|nr:hypothetical protein C8R46DRAFT_1210112 [Mycena filopes]